MKRKRFMLWSIIASLIVITLVTTVASDPSLVHVLFGTSGTANAMEKVTIPNIPISHRDRVYTADQFSNAVTVTDPVDNKLLGVISLGAPAPGNVTPLYTGQLLVHGMGFSPDHRTLVVVSIGSNSVAFIDTATNAVKHITYVGRSPHEAFFTPDGKYGYVCSSFNPETVVIDVASHQIVGTVPQPSAFCPNIAVTPDGSQVWFTLKDTGKVAVFDARPPFSLLKTITTGPITNHVNIARNANGTFAYVTVGGLNQVQVFRTDDFSKVATIPVGQLPHGIWPSGDGTRIFVGLENGDQLVEINALTNTVVSTSPIGQAAQAIVYVPDAVPAGSSGTQGLEPLSAAEASTHLSLVPADKAQAQSEQQAPTSVTLL
jgi:YVTN family beta-propeller protein